MPLVSILKSGIAGPLPALNIPRLSVFYAPLRQNTFLIGVFHLAHLGHRVSHLHQLGVRIASGQNDMHHLWPITHDDHWCGAHKADWGRARTWSLPESVA